MADVFISYSKANRAEAEALARALQERSIDVWWDDALYADYKFPQAIVTELDKAKAVVVIWSETSIGSDWVRSEAERARQQKKLIATYVPGFDRSKILPPFSVYHAEDVSNIRHISDVVIRLAKLGRKFDAAIDSQELLPLLQCCSAEELHPLAEYVKKSWTQALTSEKHVAQNWPDHTRYPEAIDREFRLCGGHHVANVARSGITGVIKAGVSGLLKGGEGPPYREIVADVCRRMKAPIDSDDNVQAMELALVNKLFQDAFSKMSPKEQEEILANLNDEMRRRGYAAQPSGLLTAPALIGGGAAAIEASGFLAYQYGVIVANALAQNVLGHGLSLAANASLTRAIGIFAGPAGWIATGLLTAATVAGPAYRVTMPGVAHIAHLRLARMSKALADAA